MGGTAEGAAIPGLGLRDFAAAVLLAPLRLLEPVMAGLQRLVGLRGLPWLFLAPNLLFFGTFVIVPLILNFGFSVTGGPELALSERPFVGAEQYGRLLACTDYLDPNSCQQDRFWRAIFNTLRIVSFQVVSMVLVSLITALVLDRQIRGRGFFRAAFFFPVLLSPVVVALVWKWILQRDGVLNAALEWAGFEKVLFLISPGWANFWVVFVSVWAHMGFYMLVLLAGLQAIPRELYEAAAMDGTPRRRVLFRITLPLLWPSLLVVILLALIRGAQTFDEVYVLTGGGPGSATFLLVQYIYETGFANQVQNFGLAAAASVLLGAVLFALTLVQLLVVRRRSPA